MSGGESSGSPRWSVVTPVTAVPAPMAGLPGSSAIVWRRPAVVRQRDLGDIERDDRSGEGRVKSTLSIGAASSGSIGAAGVPT